MICDNDDHSARRQTRAQCRQRPRQPFQLIVHRDAERLEETREIRWTGARTERAANRANQFVARREPLSRATPHDLARETRRARLAALLLEDLRQLALVRAAE